MHYLDDFLIIDPLNSCECSQALRETFGCVIAWVSPSPLTSWRGPASQLAFLGIVIDSEGDTLPLPADKCARLRVKISEWRGRKFCRKRELLSLIGQLQHACRVVRAGRTFLRMNDLSSTGRELDHWVQLNKGFRSDRWWDLFLEDWNGVVQPCNPPDYGSDSHIGSLREIWVRSIYRQW